MKKLLSLLLLCAVGGGISSCTDDDPAPAPEPSPVAQPAPIASEIGESAFTVTWKAVEGAVGYTYTLMHKNPNGAVTVIVPETRTEALSIPLTDLKASTAYLFRIKALGDEVTTLDSEWKEIGITTEAPAYLFGPWVTFDVSYEERNSYYCRINVIFTPNDKTSAYYASCVYSSYFDDDPDDPNFEPNTEQDMIAYLLTQKPVADNKLTDTSWGYSYDFILAVVGVDAAGNPGKLHWAKFKTMPKPSTGGDEQSEASLRIQHVVINSAELEGAPQNCFATVYRFEPVDGAKTFRYEDGFYPGDFAAKQPAHWREYFASIDNAYGEKEDGYYTGWKSSNGIESTDGIYYYDVTFWSTEMAGETFELIQIAYDGGGTPGAPTCYTVTLPAELPAITEPAPAFRKAAVSAANRIARQGLRYRR